MNTLDILTSAASGGALGLLGNIANGVLAFFNTRQEHRHLIARLQIEHEGIKLQANADAAKLAGELAATREKGAAAAFAGSIQAEQALRPSYPWVNAIRSLTRPGLTWFFVGTAFLIIMLPSLMANATEMQQYAAMTIVNMAYMVTAWWFGQRQLDKTALRWGSPLASPPFGATSSPR